MRYAKRILALLACVFICCVLAACANSGGPAAVSQKGFSGHEARDPSQIDSFLDKAQEKFDGISKAADGDYEEADSAEEQSASFSQANDEYRAGKYAEAQASYEKILESDPRHYGANINLTLALLQQQKNDEAFEHALMCVKLYDDDAGAMLNAQAAGTACKFDSGVVASAVYSMLGKSIEDRARGMDSDINQAYWNYNMLWSDIETLLHGEPKESDYAELQSRLDELEAAVGDDEDFKHLRAYLDAVGADLGFGGERDATSSSADSRDDAGSSSSSASAEKVAIEHFPAVLIDKNDCLLKLTGYGHDPQDNSLNLEFTFENSASKEMGFSFGEDWMVNGKEVKLPEVDTTSKDTREHLSVAPKVAKTNKSIEDDLESFEGTIVLRDADGVEIDAVRVSYGK